MKIAIISDSHDNIPNIEKALRWINKEGIKTIIHCGDLCAPSILSSVIVPNFVGQIHLVNGNVGDPPVLEKMCQDFENVHFYSLHYSNHARKMTKRTGTVMGCGEITINRSSHPELAKDLNSSAKSPQGDNINIAFTHSPNNAKELAQTGEYDYVFYGHTHRPWIEQMNIKTLEHKNKKTENQINQLTNQQLNHLTVLVNPGTLAGMFYKATFAVLDTQTGKLKLEMLERIK